VIRIARVVVVLVLVPVILAGGAMVLWREFGPEGCACSPPPADMVRKWCAEHEEAVVQAAVGRGEPLDADLRRDDYWNRYRAACEEAFRARGVGFEVIWG
jgi:hypothetical protein